MTLVERRKAIQSLTREDELRLLHDLSQPLTQEGGISADELEVTVPVWSHYNAFEGAATLLQVINQAIS